VVRNHPGRAALLCADRGPPRCSSAKGLLPAPAVAEGQAARALGPDPRARGSGDRVRVRAGAAPRQRLLAGPDARHHLLGLRDPDPRHRRVLRQGGHRVVLPAADVGHRALPDPRGRVQRAGDPGGGLRDVPPARHPAPAPEPLHRGQRDPPADPGPHGHGPGGGRRPHRARSRALRPLAVRGAGHRARPRRAAPGRGHRDLPRRLVAARGHPAGLPGPAAVLQAPAHPGLAAQRVLLPPRAQGPGPQRGSRELGDLRGRQPRGPGLEGSLRHLQLHRVRALHLALPGQHERQGAGPEVAHPAPPGAALQRSASASRSDRCAGAADGPGG